MLERKVVVIVGGWFGWIENVDLAVIFQAVDFLKSLVTLDELAQLIFTIFPLMP